MRSGARAALRCTFTLLVAFGCAGPYDDLVVPPRSETARSLASLDLGAWQRAEIPGFTFYTPMPEDRAVPLIRRVDRFSALVERFVFGTTPSGRERPVDVTIFSDRAQYLQFYSADTLGYATRGDAAPSIVIDGSDASANARLVLNHELVHAVLYARGRYKFPRWFHEGLAEFFSTTSLRGDLATVGNLAHHRMPVIRAVAPPRLPILFSSEGRFGQREQAYSWLFVHYGLLSGAMGGVDRSAAFWRFVSLVSAGAPWRSAYDRAFDVPAATLEAELDLHRQKVLHASVVPKLNVEIPLRGRVPSFESVSRLDAVRHLAHRSEEVGAGREDLSERLYDRILVELPEDADAMRGKIAVAIGRGDVERGAALWEQYGTTLKQESPLEALVLLARLRHAQYAALDAQARGSEGSALVEEARSSYRAALDRTPDRPSLWIQLGDTYVLDEAADAGPGIEAFERGLDQTADFDPHVELGLANLYLRTGELARARSVLLAIIDAYRETEWSREAEDLLDRYDLK